MKKLLLLIGAALPVAALAQNTGIGTITPTDQLHTTGTVRFEGYRGPGTRVMQIDSSGRLIVTGAGPIFSATPGAAIADNGCSAGNGAFSSIIVSGLAAAAASAKISVRVNITHTFDGDLRILLVSPAGAILNLAYSNGGSGDNFTNTVFSDAATNLLTTSGAPFTGKYKPAGNTSAQCLITPTVASFGAIGGGTINPNGSWTLKVFDGAAGDVGTLNSWAISFSGPESFTTADQNNYIPKFNAGNLDPSNIYQDPSTGNVSIGTTAVLYPLSVYGTGAGIVQYDPGNGVNVGTYTNSYGGGLQTYNNNALTFATNAAAVPQMTLSTAGNLGIGLASNLAARLHVVSNGAALMQIENTTALATGTTVDMVFKNGNAYTGMIRTRGTGANASALAFCTNATTLPGYLAERMTISDAGSVGIGNTNPSYNLDVTGSFRNTGALVLSGGTPLPGKVLTAITSTGNAAWQYPPGYNTAFKARLDSINVIPSFGTTVVDTFTTVFDDGNNFNALTGVYTAPATGLYQFNAHLEGGANDPHDYFKVYLQVNNATVEKYTGEMGDQYIGSCDFTAMIKLTAGQQVRLVLDNDLYTGFYVFGNSVGEYCYFSGYRVY